MQKQDNASPKKVNGKVGRSPRRIKKAEHILAGLSFSKILQSKTAQSTPVTNTERFRRDWRKVDILRLSEYYLYTLGTELRKFCTPPTPRRRKSGFVSSQFGKKRRNIKHRSLKKLSAKKCTKQYLHRLSVDLGSIERELSEKYSRLEDLGKQIEDRIEEISSVSSEEERDKIEADKYFISIDKISTSDEESSNNSDFKIQLLPQESPRDEDEEVKMFEPNNGIDSIHEEDSFWESEEEFGENTKISQTRFYDLSEKASQKKNKGLWKRKRIMSNIDQIPIKKISPKKTLKQRKRKGSINDKEFFAFYSAFEKHSKNKMPQMINSDTTPEDNSTLFGTFSSPPKYLNSNKNSSKDVTINQTSLELKKTHSKGDLQTFQTKGAQKRSSYLENSQNSKKSSSILSNDLGSIVDALKEIENEI